MTIVARSRPELNLKKASWQHDFTFVPRALFAIEGKLLPCTDKSNFMSILDELPNPDKSTDSQQADSATVAGIYIRDSKGKNMMPSIWYLIPIISPFTFSLKEATRERPQDCKPITDYHACRECNSKTVSVKYPHQR